MNSPVPHVQVGPVLGVALWLCTILLVVGVLGGITVVGAVTFAVIGALVLAAAVVLLSRLVNRLFGRHAKRRR